MPSASRTFPPLPKEGVSKFKTFHELAQGVGSETPPKHIDYMRQHELVDYCEVSEKGHYKWYPNGVMVQKLILDYASRLAHAWGAVEMKNPIVIRGDHNVVGELMGEFHERDYQVDGGRGVCYLRYASDPLAFPLGVASFLRCDSVNCYRCGLLQVPVPESIPSFRLNEDS